MDPNLPHIKHDRPHSSQKLNITCVHSIQDAGDGTGNLQHFFFGSENFSDLGSMCFQW